MPPPPLSLEAILKYGFNLLISTLTRTSSARPPPPDDGASGSGGAGEAGSGGGGPPPGGVLLEQLMDLLDRPLYTMSGPDLDDLLQLIEVLVAPLANLKEKPPAEPAAAATSSTAAEADSAGAEGAGREGAETGAAAAGDGGESGGSAEEESKMEVDPAPAAAPALAAAPASAPAAAATAPSEKYEWVKVPAPVVQHARLRLLCSVLRLEACSDNSFQVWCGICAVRRRGGGGLTTPRSLVCLSRRALSPSLVFVSCSAFARLPLHSSVLYAARRPQGCPAPRLRRMLTSTRPCACVP